MELLDKAYVEAYGKPEVTEVYSDLREGHGISVTSYSYKTIYESLGQIEEMGKVYTHSEMLFARSYPKIGKIQIPYWKLRRELSLPN